MTNEAEPSIVKYDEDISNAEPPSPLPEQEYPVMIAGAVQKISGAGNRYVEVRLRVDPDDYPADYPVEEAPDGTILVYRRVPIGATKSERYRMRQFCEAIGAPTSARIDLDDWIGLSAMATVKHEEYEGEVRATVFRVQAA